MFQRKKPATRDTWYTRCFPATVAKASPGRWLTCGPRVPQSDHGSAVSVAMHFSLPSIRQFTLGDSTLQIYIHLPRTYSPMSYLASCFSLPAVAFPNATRQRPTSSHSKRVISKHSERKNRRRDRPVSQLYYGKEDSSAVILPNK